MQKRKRILFITHEASYTGAPILFLNLVKLVKERGEYDINILSVKDGPLAEEFEKLGNYTHLKAEDYNREKNTFKRIVNKILFALKLIGKVSFWTSCDVAFNNTLWNGKIIRFFSKYKKLPLASYVHELENSYKWATKHNEAQPTLEYSQLLASPSQHNKKELAKLSGFDINNFRMLHYYIIKDCNSHRNHEEKLQAKKNLCEQYNIPLSNTLVMGMGTVDERKGVDYFIETANKLKDNNVSFFWLGQAKDASFKEKIDATIKEHNIHNFHYLGPRPHSLENFLPYDIFFLSSREDPYPVVVLEAAIMGIPTVCFKESGGILDFVSDNCGWVVNSFSADEASNTISHIDENDIIAKGEKAFDKVIAWHTDTDKIYADFKEIISQLKPVN